LPAVSSSPDQTEATAGVPPHQDALTEPLKQAATAQKPLNAADATEQSPPAAGSGKERLPLEAFATLPPAEADYHQSLKDAESVAGQSSDSLTATSDPKRSMDSSGSPVIPDGFAAASSLPEVDSVAMQQPVASDTISQDLAAQDLTAQDPTAQDSTAQDPTVQTPTTQGGSTEEEAWEESTVWTGSDEGGDDDLPTVVLPMQLARLDSAGASHVGRQRDHNEDNFNIQTEISTSSSLSGQQFSAKGLYILCDGMGGHSGGEVASAMVVAELKRYFAEHWQAQFPSREMIQAAIASANKVVYDANESDDRLGNGRMGTTLVLVLIKSTQVAFAHVGDSRLYTYSRRQGLMQRTVDHEVGQLEVMRGVEPDVAYARPESYQLTQALGPKDSEHINPGLEFMELQEDTLFLLCSDGLSDYSLIEDHVEEKVAPLLGSQAVLEQGVSDLVYLANELSGHDNITAVAIRAKVRPDSKALAQ